MDVPVGQVSVAGMVLPVSRRLPTLFFFSLRNAHNSADYYAVTREKKNAAHRKSVPFLHLCKGRSGTHFYFSIRDVLKHLILACLLSVWLCDLLFELSYRLG